MTLLVMFTFTHKVFTITLLYCGGILRTEEK